jgi:predicted alpha/beta superfamily hydrolase
MKMLLRISFLLFIFYQPVRAQVTHTSFPIYSKNVKDSFMIRVSSVGPLNSLTPSSTVYYLDADLKSGKKLRGLLPKHTHDSSLQNVLFVGIAHKGDYHVLRRRDFIPPAFGNEIKTKENDGHADRFYKFLSEELIPIIKNQYHVNERRTLIGHSFGGLFACYCLFKKETLFANYMALSPSLWVNNYDLFNYEQEYKTATGQLPAHLFLSAGGKEKINHILAGNRRMKKLLEERKYEGLTIDYTEYPGKMHNSQVPLSMEYILSNTKF